MRISHGGESLRHVKFHEIKDFEYFKQIFKGVNDLQLKEILSVYIFKLTTRYLDHKNYIYLTQRTIDGYDVGTKINQSTQNLSKRTPLFRLNKNIDQILTKILHINIPVLQKLKTQSRFLLLTQSQIFEFPFNRLIRKNHETFDGIFYIVQGQVKITQNAKIIKVIGQGNFLGLQQISYNQQFWTQTIQSNCNSVKLWFLHKDSFQIAIDSAQQTIRQKFIQYYTNQSCLSLDQKIGFDKNSLNMANTKKQETYGRNKTKNMSEKFERDKSERKSKNTLTLPQFLKRYDQFKRKDPKLNDAGFNEYLKKKKIIIRLQQMMKMSKQNMKVLKNSKYMRSLQSNRQNIRISKAYTKTSSGEYDNYAQSARYNRPRGNQTQRSSLYKSNILNRLVTSSPMNQNQLFTDSQMLAINQFNNKKLQISRSQANDF